MAPKSKAIARKKKAIVKTPKAAAASAAITKPSAVPAPQKSSLATSTAAADASVGQRALFRRATEDRVDGSIRTKLGMFPRQQLDNNTNAAGQTLAEVVKEEHLRLRPSRKYIALRFWQKVIGEFQLSGTLAASMKPPEEAESVSKDLDVVLRAAHSDNPAAKSPEKLVRLLGWAPAMNRTEFYGLLMGSFASPSMSAKHSAIILEAVIKFIARTKAHEAFPDYLGDHPRPLRPVAGTGLGEGYSRWCAKTQLSQSPSFNPGPLHRR